MKINITVAVGIITLIGSILVGGSSFGDLSSQTKMHAIGIEHNRERIVELDLRLRSELLKAIEHVAEMRADIRWIKEALDQKGGD